MSALVAMTACAPTSKTVKDYSIIENTSGLVLDTSQDRHWFTMRSSVPTLAAYNRFIIDPVQVNYTDPEMEELDAE